MELLSVAEATNCNKPGCSYEIQESTAHSSKAIKVPKARDRNKYSSLMVNSVMLLNYCCSTSIVSLHSSLKEYWLIY